MSAFDDIYLFNILKFCIRRTFFPPCDARTARTYRRRAADVQPSRIPTACQNFMVRPILPFARSSEIIFTFTISPIASTSLGCAMRFFDI